jgi:hypothetical protein
MENFELLSAIITPNHKTTKEKIMKHLFYFLFCGFAVTAKTVLLKEFTHNF